jgi:hypothetical protein
VSKEGALA